MSPDPELRIVVAGVASSGKTTVATALAERIGATALDADDLHPESNVAKMSLGIPLTDDDRWPWLARVASELQRHDRVVLACSALRRSYRDVLRAIDDVAFVFLDVTPELATERARDRAGHFMGADMVAGQFAALERPEPDETDVLSVDASLDVDTIIATVAAARFEPMKGDGAR